MAAIEESTSVKKLASHALGEAADAHHAIKATAAALADRIYNQADLTVVGMYEALGFSIKALDDAIGRAMEHVEKLQNPHMAL